MFVYNFDSGVNFCGEKFVRDFFFAGTFFCGSSKKKTQKSQKFSDTGIALYQCRLTLTAVLQLTNL